MATTRELQHPTRTTAPRAPSPNLSHVSPRPLLDPIQSVSRETISWRRKLFHVLGIGCVGFTYGLSTATPVQAFTILAVVAAIFVSCDSLRFFLPSLNKRIKRDFGPYMRNYELNRLSGSSWFFFSALITIGLFPKEIAALAFVYLGLGDPLASWVGVRWGRIRLPGGKSLEGSLTLFATCLVAGAALITGMIALGTAGALAGVTLPSLLLIAAASSLFAAVGEWLPLRGLDDNFVVPLVTAGMTTLTLPLLLL